MIFINQLYKEALKPRLICVPVFLIICCQFFFHFRFFKGTKIMVSEEILQEGVFKRRRRAKSQILISLFLSCSMRTCLLCCMQSHVSSNVPMEGEVENRTVNWRTSTSGRCYWLSIFVDSDSFNQIHRLWNSHVFYLKP